MENNSAAAFQNSEISWPRSLRFYLLLIFEIPALVCSVLVLCYLLMNRTRRHALHNHAIIVIHILTLIFLLIDVPWYLDFLLRGTVQPSSQAHCLIWWLVDLGVYNTAAIILAWTSIERHILIFHDGWVSTPRKRLCIHYAPLIILLVYAFIYYMIVIFFPPCQHTYDYTLPVCAATPCHLLDGVLGIWEMGVHGCLVTIMIAFFSLSLLIRVIVQKRRYHRAFRWKRYRKKTIQLLFLSTIYLVFNLPIMTVLLARFCGLPSNVAVQEQLVFFFFTYWVMLLLPVVSVISLPDLRKAIYNFQIKYTRRHVTVVPFTRNAVALSIAERHVEAC